MRTAFSFLSTMWSKPSIVTPPSPPDLHIYQDPDTYIIKAESVSCFYGNFRAVSNVSLNIERGKITAFIGASGCGKSTLLKTFNRMNEVTSDNFKATGTILVNGFDIHDRNIDVCLLRGKHVGMVFQKSTPFPKSIRANVSFPLEISGIQKKDRAGLVEEALKKAALWNEVKDRLDEPGLSLSGGQQQRLCIARALVLNPDVLLLDEPCSALDPGSTTQIEDTIFELAENGLTIVIVTHNMQQAQRVSDYTAFFHIDENEPGDRKPGKLIEFGRTEDIFQKPKETKTLDFITGKFG